MVLRGARPQRYILYIIYLGRPLCNNYFFSKQEHCFEKVVQRICDLFEKVFLFNELENKQPLLQATNTAKGLIFGVILFVLRKKKGQENEFSSLNLLS